MTGTGPGPARVFISTVIDLSRAGTVYQYDFAVETGAIYQADAVATGASLVSAETRIEPVAAVQPRLLI